MINIIALASTPLDSTPRRPVHANRQSALTRRIHFMSTAPAIKTPIVAVSFVEDSDKEELSGNEDIARAQRSNEDLGIVSGGAQDPAFYGVGGERRGGERVRGNGPGGVEGGTLRKERTSPGRMQQVRRHFIMCVPVV